MKCWRKRFGAILLVIASSCSALAQESATELEERVANVRDPQLRQVVRDGLPEADPLAPLIDDLDNDQIRQAVRDRAAAERATQGLDPSYREAAQKEKRSSPLYRDSGAREGSNWIAQAFEAIARWLQRDRAPRAPNISPPMFGGLGQGLIYLVWGILIGLLAVFLYFAFRHFSWRSQLRRKARAILDDDEPDYSLDEWLQKADELEAQGRYREAVRALYLACLIRFDEARIARFVRGETNWEHFRRVEQSPLRPDGLNFRPATLAFDRIWYGMEVRGRDDVQAFRTWYVEITELTRRKAA
ncbi:MAG: hypothetical protein IT363_02745 [Methanoregulaceae archaeon]|nr:hypothetical protein [Methanoregulaceae archaeon]